MTKYILFPIAILMLFLVSCQNKKASISQTTEEKSPDEKMERITELYNSGQYAEFIKEAEAELSKSQKDFGFYLSLSDAYGNLNNYEKAFYYARKQLELEPSDYYTMIALGNYYFVLEKLDSAEFYYSKVLEIRPTYVRANLNLAQLFENQNKKNEAIEQYLKAIELFKQNNFKEEVIQYSKQVLKLDPNNKLAKENLVPPYF